MRDVPETALLLIVVAAVFFRVRLMVFQLGRSAIRVVPRVVRFLDASSHGARRPIHFGALAPALLLEDREHSGSSSTTPQTHMTEGAIS